VPGRGRPGTEELGGAAARSRRHWPTGSPCPPPTSTSCARPPSPSATRTESRHRRAGRRPSRAARRRLPLGRAAPNWSRPLHGWLTCSASPRPTTPGCSSPGCGWTPLGATCVLRDAEEAAYAPHRRPHEPHLGPRLRHRPLPLLNPGPVRQLSVGASRAASSRPDQDPSALRALRCGSSLRPVVPRRRSRPLGRALCRTGRGNGWQDTCSASPPVPVSAPGPGGSR
jgi:hypothetical protein